MQLTGTTIRVACNQAAPSDFVNAIGSQAPAIPKTGSVSIPCAVFSGDPSQSGNLVTDLGNVLTANCVMRNGNAAGTVLFQQVIAASAFNAGLTYAQWTAGTAAHFTFTMSPTDTNITANPLFIAIGLTTTNAGDIPLVYCGKAQIKDYGIFNAAAPTVPDYTSWSKAEADGRYALVSSAGVAANVTGVGTGAAGSLETIATTALAVPTLHTFYNVGADERQDWLLATSTAANATGVQRPNDFNASTNPKVWFRK